MRILFFAIAFSVVSCISPRVVSVDQADNTNLSAYKTFNFYAGGDSLSQQLAWALGVAKSEIAGEMKRKGYQQSSSISTADLLINLGMVVNEKVQTRQTNFQQDAPRYIGQRRYSWKSQEVEAGRYQEGTISVHLVDNKENKMVWNGVVESVVPKRREKVQVAIQKGVERLFSRLPANATQ